MNKKWMAIALALVMMLTSAAALAASSITTADLTTGGASLDLAVVNAVSQYIATTKGPAIDYFGETIKKQVAKLLPAGVSADRLVLYEAIGIHPTRFTVAQLKGGVSVGIASAFAESTKMIVLIGVPNGLGGVEWFPVKATFIGSQLTFRVSSAVAKKITTAKELCTLAVFAWI